MIKKNSQLRTITVAMALTCVSAFACAEVVRCQSETGSVTYTDSACGNDVQVVQMLAMNTPQATHFIYQPPSRIEQAPTSQWANIYIAPRNRKIDAESVRSARIKMISLDGPTRTLQAYK